MCSASIQIGLLFISYMFVVEKDNNIWLYVSIHEVIEFGFGFAISFIFMLGNEPCLL